MGLTPFFVDLSETLHNHYQLDTASEKTGERLFRKLISKGYIVCNRKTLFRIDPPLIINEGDFNNFIQDFRKILES